MDHPRSYDFATVNDWAHDTDRHFEELVCACLGMATHVEKLQRLLDERPAMNAGLVDAYVEWSSKVYQADMMAASGDEVRN